jgi:hypothetical protein
LHLLNLLPHQVGAPFEVAGGEIAVVAVNGRAVR